MNSVDLQFFIAVSQSGGMCKAAQQLNTVQSNVTARIRRLEQELGQPLFYRNSTGVMLTSAGQRLLPYALHSTQLLNDAKRVVLDFGEPSGPLSIGSMETTAAFRLPTLFSGFLAKFPDVDLQLATGPTEDLITQVMNRQIEGAFVCAPVRHPELETLHAFDETLSFVTPAWIKSPKELTSHLCENPNLRILVFRTGCSYRERLEQYLSTLGAVEFKRMELGTLDGILGCVSVGMGISLIPDAIARTALNAKNVAVHKMPDKLGQVETLFTYRKDTFLSGAMSRLIEDIQNRNAMLEPKKRA